MTNDKENTELIRLAKTEEENLNKCNKELSTAFKCNSLNDYISHLGEGLGLLWSISCQRSGIINFFKSSKKGMKLVKNSLAKFASKKKTSRELIKSFGNLVTDLCKGCLKSNSKLKNVTELNNDFGKKLINLILRKGDGLTKNETQFVGKKLNNCLSAMSILTEGFWTVKNGQCDNKNNPKDLEKTRFNLENQISAAIENIRKIMNNKKNLYDSSYRNLKI